LNKRVDYKDIFVKIQIYPGLEDIRSLARINDAIRKNKTKISVGVEALAGVGL